MLLTANRTKERVKDFSGGQNSAAEPSNVGQNQAELLENCTISLQGQVAQRNGITVLGTANSTTNIVRGLFNFNAGGTLNTLLRCRATKIQRLASDYSDWTDITGLTTLTTDLTTNFAQGIDKCFILNGTDHVFSVDNTLTVTDEGSGNTSFPLSTFAEYATNNRMFASGSLVDANRDIVWFSNTLDPQTWDRTLNLFKVRSGNGGKITWLKMYRNNELIVYKNDAIFVLDMTGATPLTDWTLQPLSVKIGCPAGRTVADIGNDHIFLANDGVRILSRTTFDKIDVGRISDPIKDIIDTINQDAIQNSVGWFENGLYILGVPIGTATQPNKFLIWDSFASQRNGGEDNAGGWTTVKTSDWTLSCMSSFSFGDNKNTFVAGAGTATSLCYKVLSGTTDNGTTITQTIQSRQHDFGDPFIKKIFDPAQFLAQSTTNGIYSYSIDIDRTGFVQVGTANLAGSLQTPFTTPATTGSSSIVISNFRTKFAGRGNTCRLQIQNSTSSTTPNFLEYTIYSRPYGGRI